jgi:hypothetical protein
MILAIEDAISDAVVRRLLRTYQSGLMVFATIGQKGNAYLRAKARDLNRTAAKIPVFLVTDLDTPNDCPPSLVTRWLGAAPEEKMLFRVAVMEIESWVVADRSGASALLGVPEHRIPENTDAIAQPKEFIVNLARNSRFRRIRDELVPREGSTAAVGPAFNSRIVEFVESTWQPHRAAIASQSLARCIRRLEQFGDELAS